ncbi:MAG: site-specific DNA-methyltransferase [Microscillaceae bacterium]|nr:site-specific DNA-methyltransferase [Microscillaceae bacterium]MDW8459654.1 site-specific DNA-methyltransferase [Cytophagales bacterium]
MFNADSVRVPYNLDIEKYTSPKAWGSHKGIDKSYSPNELGKIPEDWWLISPINSQSKERLGYPTQKPEALLERINKASSNEGNMVLDAYCGCGTTIAVAERLHRRGIGIDITYQAI